MIFSNYNFNYPNNLSNELIRFFCLFFFLNECKNRKKLLNLCIEI
jgi:hypothetical protein